MALTPQDVEARRYTYVACIRVDGGAALYQNFLVPSPHKEAALAQAKRFVLARGWRLTTWGDSQQACRCCHCFMLYPRNYVKKSRALWAQGLVYVHDADDDAANAVQ